MPRTVSPDWRSAKLGYRILFATIRPPVRAIGRLRVRGLEHVPAQGGALVASNHMSLADPVLINSALPRPTYWLAKSNLFGNAAGRAAMSTFGCIKVDRDTGRNEGAVSAASRALDEGKLVGIFPEGTRSAPGVVREGRTGVARIAALSGAPILPVGIDASALWPRGARGPRLGKKAYLAIGPAFHVDLKPEDADDRERVRAATDDIMARIKALWSEASRARQEGLPWR